MDQRIRLLLAALDEAFDRKSWHGTTLRGSVRGVNAGRAAWRPGPGRHNIREIVVHAAYWKYALKRRLTGEKRGSFELSGSNWFARPAGGENAWRRDVDLLDRMHRELRAAVVRLRAADLGRRPGGSFTVAALVRGITAHDLYHAGQIQLLKRLGKR